MLKLKDGFSGERALVLPRILVETMENDPLASLLHITDIGYYPKARFHFRERREPINQYVLIHCVDGAGWVRCGSDEFRVGANQFFILPAGSTHAYGSDESAPWTIYWIHFKGKLASFYAGAGPHPVDVRPGIHSRISIRTQLFEEIFTALKTSYSKENMRYVCAVFHHYLGTLRYLQQYRTSGSHSSDAADFDLATAAIHYMKENVERKITLAEIAAHIGYSPSHFSLLFQQQTGHSPISYFNLLKVQQACQLLDFTDMKINQVCFKIGIDDTYYFSRLFTKIMGLSPRDYRKTKKG